MCSISRWNISGDGGASQGCVVRRTLDRTMSVGARSTHGTSMRSPRQNFVSRQRCAGSQVKPNSSSTTFRSGNLVNTPSHTSDDSAAWKAGACAA